MIEEEKLKSFIITLTGPSGCGKTTVMTKIMDLKNLLIKDGIHFEPCLLKKYVTRPMRRGEIKDQIEGKPLDIISVDCGTLLDGFNGDSCYTFCVGEVSDEIRQLLKTTKESLYLGIEQAVAGKHVGDIGYTVQNYCEAQGYGVVRELTGHGIGREMHEDPQVPNYGRRGNGAFLKAGMCIAIEPMITMGKRDIWLMDDRWTVKTRDGKPAAHFEHTIAIRRGKAEILSSFEEVEQYQVEL